MKILRACDIITITCMIAMISACSFKKNPNSPPEASPVAVFSKEKSNQTTLSIADAIRTLPSGDAIDFLKRFPMEDLDKYQENGLSLLDIAIKNGSTDVLSYLLSQGLNPINFSNESEQILSFNKTLDGIHKSYLDVALADIFDNVFPRYEALTENLDKKHPTQAACRYLVKSLINQHFEIEFHQFFLALGRFTRFSDRAANSLSAILQSKSCGPVKQQLSFEDLSKWYSMEISRQAGRHFESPSLIQFFNTLAHFKNVSVDIPASIGVRKVNPLVFLLAMNKADWNMLSDSWWNLLSPVVSQNRGYYDLDIYRDEKFCLQKERHIGNSCAEEYVINKVCSFFELDCFVEKDPFDVSFPPPPPGPNSGGNQ